MLSKMVVSKRGTSTALHFITGLILAVMSILFFVQVGYPLIKGSDKSIDAVDALADKMAQVVDSDIAYAEPVLIQLENNELMLFFDKGTGDFVFFDGIRQSDFDKGPFLLSDEKYNFKYFVDKANYYYVFKKPKDCGDSACISLCRTLNITRYDYLKFNFVNTEPWISDSNKNIFLIECKPSYVRNLENVSKFYRKPYFRLGDVADKFTIAEANEKYPASSRQGYNSAFIYGALLQSSLFKNSKEIGKKEMLKFEKNKHLYLSERKQDEWTDLFWVTPDFSVYVQPYGDDIVLCYKPPCLDQNDEIYLSFDKRIDNCIETPHLCNSLVTGIELYYNAYNEPVVFKSRDNKLHISLGGMEYSFDKDIEMYLTKAYHTDLEGDELGPFTEFFFEVKRIREASKSYDKVILNLGSNSFILSTISSLKPEEEGKKPRLLFIVDKEYDESAS